MLCGISLAFTELAVQRREDNDRQDVVDGLVYADVQTGTIDHFMSPGGSVPSAPAPMKSSSHSSPVLPTGHGNDLGRKQRSRHARVSATPDAPLSKKPGAWQVFLFLPTFSVLPLVRWHLGLRLFGYAALSLTLMAASVGLLIQLRREAGLMFLAALFLASGILGALGRHWRMRRRGQVPPPYSLGVSNLLSHPPALLRKNRRLERFGDPLIPLTGAWIAWFLDPFTCAWLLAAGLSLPFLERWAAQSTPTATSAEPASGEDSKRDSNPVSTLPSGLTHDPYAPTNPANLN